VEDGVRVHHLNCGTINVPGGVSIIGTGGLLRRARGVTHCLLVETGDGLLLVDSGIGVRDCLSPTPLMRAMLAVGGFPCDVGQTAFEQVRRLGFRAEDVRHIALTHFHFDHAGGLPDFPQAQVHVYALEHQAVTEPRDAYERYPYRQEHWAHDPRWVVHGLQDERWFGFERTPWVELGATAFCFVPLTGHTRGHSAVAVGGDGRCLLHCGDAYTYHGEVDPIAPRLAPYAGSLRHLMDLNKSFRQIGAHSHRLRELAAAHGDEVVLTCSHDPCEFDKFFPSQP
jgi:glyoxylase-like metal-dependent hydrolase (beta-lactamase superfamily II)